ncbi:phage virion morphogenesis protein [Carboxylicivirga linearis]|uniref:Phage virion morphogenesis protein n=1 Tax=Carboxylicivirga linearis TaxID=1628157 RepID=A0ABS5K205_9BACT|nr:phage virion morphogenesis protein [Carboxylicivirga linearis]MBS2100696.1 phage virion morphogenesis protein [Carboxylicivirga linearis]
MNETLEYIQLLDRVSTAVTKLPQVAATEAVNFSKERFRAQNWVDINTEPWKKRKPVRGESKRTAGRAVLVKSGRLRRSIRKVSVTAEKAVIGTDVPYAEAHNNGFRGRVIQSVRSHTRRTMRGEVNVRAHSRTINQNIPRRRFIGTSATLDRRLTRVMTATLIKAIKG